METIGQLNNPCLTKATLQGCANGVPYLMVVSDGCCDEAVLKYINLVDGTVSTTRPTDFSLGECENLECPPIFETESFIATAGQTTFTLANNPFADVVFSRNGAVLLDDAATVSGNVVTYVASANDGNALLADDHITISYLYKDPNCSQATVSSSICFSFNDGGNNIEVKTVYINGSVVFYENGVKVTDAARIAQLQGFVANANADNVICCTDCAGGSSTKVQEGNGINVTGTGTLADPYIVSTDIPPYKTCYKIGETTATTKTTFGGYVEKSVGNKRYINELKIQIASPFSTYQTFDLSANPILVWDGANWANLQDIYDALDAVGYWDAVKTKLGCSGLKDLVRINSTGSTMSFVTYHPTEACTTNINANFVAVKLVDTPGGAVVPLGDYDSLSGTQTFADAFNGTPFEVVYANEVTSYYENGIKVTDATRLAQLQAVVTAADPNSIVCCDCGASNTQSFDKIVYVDTNNPNSATIFDENTPASVNDDANKANDNYMYIGADNSVWIWDNASSTYKTYTTPAATEWNFYNTSTDAGSNKTNSIQRSADIYINQARFGQGAAGSNGENILATVGGLSSLSTGFSNVAVGSFPLNKLTTGNFNVGIGRYAGQNLTTGNTNVVIGQLALRTATTSNDNVSIGANSGGSLATGNANVFLGPAAGLSQTSGNNNISIGQNTNLVDPVGSNQLNIGNSIYGTDIGNSTLQNLGIGDSTPNSTWDVNGSFGANLVSTNAATYTLRDLDYGVVASAGVSTIVLPTPSADNFRRVYRLTNKSTSPISVTGNIDGVASSTYTIPAGGSVDFQSSGASWWAFTNYVGTNFYWSNRSLGGQTIPVNTATTIINWDTITSSPTTAKRYYTTDLAAWNSATGEVTIPKSGLYHIEGQIVFSSYPAVAGDFAQLAAFANASTVLGAWQDRAFGTYTGNYRVEGSCDVYLFAGDKITFVAQTGKPCTTSTNPLLNQFSIVQL